MGKTVNIAFNHESAILHWCEVAKNVFEFLREKWERGFIQENKKSP
jgi:hypothetical protein